MLKITPIINDNGQQTLVLEGRLVDPWIAELEKAWSDVRQGSGVAPVSIDLKDVTAISVKGEALLRRMMSEGAKFHCCRGVLTKHVVRQIGQECTKRIGRVEA